MELQTLRLFRAVADAGSFSKAAVELHYAQSNLSTKMLQLEKELHGKLFYRTGRGVILTPKGKTLYRYACSLLALADEALQAMQDDEGDAGSIHIGSMESTAAAFLPGFLSSFHRKYPRVCVRVDTGTTAAALEKLLDHRIDGAFVAGPFQHPELESIFLRNERLVLLSGCGDEGADIREILSKRPLLVFPAGCSYRKRFERLLDDLHLLPSQVFEFNTLNAMLSSLNAGLGVSLLPASILAHIPADYQYSIHAVAESISEIPTVFAYRRSGYHSGAMRSFIGALKETEA